MKTSAAHVLHDLKHLGSPKKAKASAWFFKTGKGEYGFGDVFWGVTVPEQRVIARKYKDLPLSGIAKLLKSKVHESRLTALLILVGRFKKADEKEQARIVEFYLTHTTYINNWDLVDTSARDIIGTYLFKRNRNVLYRLSKSKNLWERRIAIIATHAFIARGEFKDTIAISKQLLSDTHDLIHKAVGWTLREMGKQSKSALHAFLKKHAKAMPRTALRYAIEHFPKSVRKKYLAS